MGRNLQRRVPAQPTDFHISPIGPGAPWLRVSPKLARVSDDRQANLFARLRQPPTPATVLGTLPVLFFGDLLEAEVATVGLNPSDQEYLSKGGLMLTGAAQRFATLASVGATNRASLTEVQCEEAIVWMRNYYAPGKPVYGWFNALTRVVEGFGASFRERTAAHLDLVQEATSPVWGDLPKAEKAALLERDLPFLEWELRAFPLRAVICTGKTVSVNVRQRLGVTVVEEGELALIKWWVGFADVKGREVGFAGWNYPLARATGLGAVGETELGQLLAARLGLEGSSGRSERTAVASASSATAATTATTPATPTQVTGSRLKGLTHPVWDGVPLPKLRYWLRWWEDEAKSAGRVENGWGREEQIERISAEIAAREQSGTGQAKGNDGNEPASTREPAASVSDHEPTEPPVSAISMTRGALTVAELLERVDERFDAVREYLVWARDNDNEQWSFRMTERPDIARAAETINLFPEDWWGVVVYSCFDSTVGAATAAPHFQEPLPPEHAEEILSGLEFPRGSVGGHRIQPAVKGAKQALVAACADHERLADMLHSGEDFDTRYRRLRAARIRQWGRTTSFDLLLRAGTLGIGGQHYKPEYAYFGGSTGPKAGFARVWGVALNDDVAVDWAERLLRTWTENWGAVADRVGVEWDNPPLEPCDQENFLCIYQERR